MPADNRRGARKEMLMWRNNKVEEQTTEEERSHRVHASFPLGGFIGHRTVVTGRTGRVR